MLNQFVQFCQYVGIILLVICLGFRSYIFEILDKTIKIKELPPDNHLQYLEYYTYLNLTLLFWLPITLVLSEFNVITDSSTEMNFGKASLESLKTSVTLWLFFGLWILHMYVISKPFSKRTIEFTKALGCNDDD